MPISKIRTKDEWGDEFHSPELVNKYWQLFYRDRIKGQRKHSAESLEWFRKRVSKDTRVKASQIIDDPASYDVQNPKGNKGMIGKLYLFEYQAEQAGDVEVGVYDRYPMVFFFGTGKTKAGNRTLTGLNIHYLTPSQRAVLYQKLIAFKTSKAWTPNVKVKLQWDLIKAAAGAQIVEKAVHSYRVDRIQSRMISIPVDDWIITIFLQLQQFVKIKDHHQSHTQTSIKKRIYKSAVSKQNSRRKK